MPGHVEGLLEVCRGVRKDKKANRITYLGNILMGRKCHGQGKVGREGVEEVGSKLYLFGCKQKDLGKFHPLTIKWFEKNWKKIPKKLGNITE